MTTTRALTLTVLTAAAAAFTLPAGAALGQEEAEWPRLDPVYCIYQEPIVVNGTTVYPGGRYCVPGP